MERIYTITGVDLVQAVAYDVMDEVGRFLKTDLEPRLRRLPEEDLVKRGQWQSIPGHHYLDSSRPRRSHVCPDCLLVWSSGPCPECHLPRWKA